jgi:hypothetical protein
VYVTARPDSLRFGHDIRIFLADGAPTGILLAEISNWTGKVIVAPRSQLDQLSKREEVRRTGVYLIHEGFLNVTPSA